MYTVYKFVAPNGNYYYGVTNNFKRRLKEHKTSKFPFGRALRKYGVENFIVTFEHFSTSELAFAREGELVTEKEIHDTKCYNVALGGVIPKFGSNNPMRNPEVVAKHPGMWTSTYNPMHNKSIRDRMITSQKCRPISVMGVEYAGIGLAARHLGQPRTTVVSRLKSKYFTDYKYL